jgi:hypothetical protein
VGHTVNYTEVEALTVSGNAASDTFNVTPSAVATAIAAADIKDARRARSPHGRRQALHCDCGSEDAVCATRSKAPAVSRSDTGHTGPSIWPDRLIRG